MGILSPNLKNPEIPTYQPPLDSLILSGHGVHKHRSLRSSHQPFIHWDSLQRQACDLFTVIHLHRGLVHICCGGLIPERFSEAATARHVQDFVHPLGLTGKALLASHSTRNPSQRLEYFG